MLDHLRLETLVGLGAASLLGYVLWGPKTTKTRAANAAGALAGLQNIGNSCFLNAVLQALASSPAVIKWLNSPPSASASPAHRQLRAALIDVIQVVNRTHQELRADPFTPAGVVACLLRLGWLIRRDEQDTHEMFYVLVSTMQEEPPPSPLALCADGLRASDGPVEADTGEPLVDWGALGARMRGDARDICGAGVPGGASGGERRRGSELRKTARGDVRTGERQNGAAVNECPAVEAGVQSGPSKDGGAHVCDSGAVSAPRENGGMAPAAAVHANGDNRATSQTVDEREDKAKDSGAADHTVSAGRAPSMTSPSDSPVTERPPAASCPPAAASSPPAAASSPPAAASSPPAAASSPPAAASSPPAAASCPPAAASSPPAAASSPPAAASSPPAAASSPPAAASSPPVAASSPPAAASSPPAAASCPPAAASSPPAAASSPPAAASSPPAATSSPPAATSSPQAAASSPQAAAADSPAVNGGTSGAGVVGRRQSRGIVHRVRGVELPAWRGVASQLRSPFTGTVSTQLVCLACGHKCAVRWENFESLSLPLPTAPRPQALSLPELLGQFSARETVDGVTCDACHRRGRFSKRTLVAKLPSALCLHLPRTTWQENGQAGKRGDHVSFFETLNMFPYTYSANITTATTGRPVSPPVDSGRHSYRLTAVIVHSGGASSGHFVTYRRRPDPADSSWFYTSDTLVSRASASEVFAAAAYMLFYDRVTLAGAGAAVPVTASPMAAALLSPVTPAMLSLGRGSLLLPPPTGEGR